MKFLKIGALIGMLSAALMLCDAVMAKEYKRITIGTEASYAPYAFKDKSGKMVGFEIDVASDLCRRMGLQCEIVDQAYDSLIPSLLSGRFDSIMAAIGITPAREKVISFSRPYVTTPMVFVTTSASDLTALKISPSNLNLDKFDADEESAIKKITSALKGKTVGVQVGSNFETFMKKFMPTVRVSTYDTTDNMMLDLTAGRIDAGMVSFNFLKPLMDKPDGKNLRTFGPSMTNGPFGSRVAAGFRKNDDQLRAMFDKAIGEAISDGSLRRLAIKWFGFDNSPKE
ncbi:transporter substrate-binding domain-containing protein [Paraburkholderia sp. 31.1]|uniref:transporter substrate-binding domain-containing protein n=1 Tax=Paraburkholderia sp. 31.1 TaxID=2615205 RepID=UPI001655A050|nr:transporter substrate-binding domain-containing protein [Paraburkholderia sp. 31.1]MBC8726315.1 transporter substrate-binding domain-containing protein [Paraburkholderia sp. 31.1]